MSQEVLVERMFEALINGDRTSARAILQDAFSQNAPADRVLTHLMWPAYEMIDRLHRADQLTTMGYHFSTRLLRLLVDQTSSRLVHSPRNGKRVLAFCGQAEGEELGAQIAVDLLEARGYHVRFAGGGAPADEILADVHENKPDVLLAFCSAAADLPGIRGIIDTLREIGAAGGTQMVAGGGVFNRAEGLAEEIGVDLSAENPMDLVELLTMPEEPARSLAAPSSRSQGTA